MSRVEYVDTRLLEHLPTLISDLHRIAYAPFEELGVLDASLDELRLLFEHLLEEHFTHDLANAIGFYERVTGENLEELHDLLLVDRYSERRSENLGHKRVRGLDFFLTHSTLHVDV